MQPVRAQSPVRALIALMLLTGVCGCRTAIQCCTSHFAHRATSPADLSQVPDNQSKASETDGPTDNEESSDDAAVKDDSDAGAPQEPARTRISRPKGVSESLTNCPGPMRAVLLPPLDGTQTPEDRLSLAEKLFPQIVPAVEPQAVADQTRLTLTSLQQMAADNSPVIRQAAADVEQARGNAIQVGLRPNPVIGYEGDTIGTARSAGYNGVLFSQEFVTANKLSIAQSAAMMLVRAAEADLRKARISLASNIRRGYFQVLVGQEQVKFTRALASLSQEVYQGQIELVAGGEAAAYEPLQLRVFAVQARNSVIESQNNLAAAWRRLAAAMGMPHLPRHIVAGSVEAVVPEVDYDRAVAVLLQRHSDLAAAQARIGGASGNLRLQQVTPIPNVTLYAALQHDDTTPLSNVSANLQLSMPVPVYNKNQGNITAAHGQLIRANQDYLNAQNELMASLADFHARQNTGRVRAASYRTELLPDQVRAYRGVYERFRVGGEGADFSQLVVAQQSLAQVIEGYLRVLTEQWDATVGLAEVLQVDDLMTMDGLQ